MDVRQRKVRVVPFQALQLCLEDIFTGRKPDHDLLRVILDQFECNIAFSGAGGVDNSSLAVLLHHPDCRMIGFLVVFKQTQCHLVHPPIAIQGYPSHGKWRAMDKIWRYSIRFGAFLPLIDT